MKKGILFILLVGIIIIPVKAQRNYPKGIYLNLNELNLMKPSADYDIIVEERTKGDIVMYGGNDYKLTSYDNSIKKRYLKKEVFAYSDGKNLFLNCFPLKLYSGYTKILNDGNKYFIFKASISQDQDLSYMFGGVGGAMQATKRYLYAYDKATKTVIPITTNTLKKLLKNNQNLLDDYLSEQNKENEEIQLKYLIMLNR